MATGLLALVMALGLSGCDPREWFVCSLGVCGYELDDVPPRAPTGLAATPGDGRIRLTWNANREPDLFAYTVHRSNTAGGPYSAVARSFETASTDEHLLTNGTTYYYRVTVSDLALNESPRSHEVSATPMPGLSVARLPAPMLTAENVDNAEIRLEWTEVPGASTYALSRSTQFEGPYERIYSANSNAYLDRDVTPGSDYYYLVAAVGSDGQVGESSNVAVASIPPEASPLTAAWPPSAARASAAAPRRRGGFRATMRTTHSTAGKLSKKGRRVRERGARARGPFRGRLIGPPTPSTRAFRAFSRGTWRARFDITMDTRRSRGIARGVALASPRRRRAGLLCLGFRLRVATKGSRVTLRGSFKTLGGTAGAGTLNARGSFRQKLGKPGKFTLSGRGTPGLRHTRDLPAKCRRLAAPHPD